MSQVDLVDAVLYADVFDCAAAEDDVWRYSRASLARAELRERLAELDGLVHRRDGFVCLAGREELLAEAPARRRRATRLHRRACRVARVLQHAPFVRGLLLTGSAAAGEAGPGADPDLLVLVAPGRLGTAFALLGPLARVTGGRVLCPNHYRSVAHLHARAARHVRGARAGAGVAAVGRRGSASWWRTPGRASCCPTPRRAAAACARCRSGARRSAWPRRWCRRGWSRACGAWRTSACACTTRARRRPT